MILLFSSIRLVFLLDKMTTKFSLEDDEKLIDMVQQREHLYSIANANYKNILMRKGAWSDISKVVGKSGSYSCCFSSTLFLVVSIGVDMLKA